MKLISKIFVISFINMFLFFCVFCEEVRSIEIPPETIIKTTLQHGIEIYQDDKSAKVFTRVHSFTSGFGKVKYSMRDCTILLKLFPQIDTKRVIGETEKILCYGANNKIFEVAIKGSVIGDDDCKGLSLDLRKKLVKNKSIEKYLDDHAFNLFYFKFPPEQVIKIIVHEGIKIPEIIIKEKD